MGNTRLPVRVDIGFGDALTALGPMADYLTLLDFPALRPRVYPAAAVIAEKVHVMVEHGMLNSRRKDLYDLTALRARLSFAGEELVAAPHATFGRRGTPLSERLPAPVTRELATDATKLAQWRGFLRCTPGRSRARRGDRRFAAFPRRALSRRRARRAGHEARARRRAVGLTLGV